MARIRLTVRDKYIQRHAEVEYLHITRRVKFHRGDEALEKLNDPSIPDAQANALERLVKFGIIVEIDEHGQYTFREGS